GLAVLDFGLQEFAQAFGRQLGEDGFFQLDFQELRFAVEALSQMLQPQMPIGERGLRLRKQPRYAVDDRIARAAALAGRAAVGQRRAAARTRQDFGYGRGGHGAPQNLVTLEKWKFSKRTAGIDASAVRPRPANRDRPSTVCASVTPE